jgi:catechol 2,3-dioxygenase-like lactoylglutathione lyase family enzyme
MLDHLGFGASNVATSKRFFAAALAPLGVFVVMEGEHGLGLGKNGKPSLWLAPAEGPIGRMHIAFTAERRADVDAFYKAALSAGDKDNGSPGLRPNYHPNYYGAFVIGPDGHNVEAVCHSAEA